MVAGRIKKGRAVEPDTIRTDVLIVGGGGAGCRAAIESASLGREVLLVSKFPISKSGATVVAESFYAAVASDGVDSAERYFNDIAGGGAGLCQRDLAMILAEESGSRVADLESYGVRFRQGEDGSIARMRAPGHSHARGMSPSGGGLAIMRGLRREVEKRPGVRLLEDAVITKILTDGNRIAGAIGLDIRKGKFFVVECRAAVIATGGYAALWLYNDVPVDCTGDGVIMALDAGAHLTDIEMLLFYPTVVIHPFSVNGVLLPSGILVEQAGAKLVNGRLEEFLPEKTPTRDVMSSLIYKEVAAGKGSPHGGVLLDLTRSPLSTDEVREKCRQLLPEKYRYLLKYGIDISDTPVEVAPMAHYTLGGIKINPKCETEAAGLYAAGEAEGNVHGANRLGGNALCETQVFGAIAGRNAAEWAGKNGHAAIDRADIEQETKKAELLFDAGARNPKPSHLKRKIQTIMWERVGPERNGAGLASAVEEIRKIREKDLPLMRVPAVRAFNLQWLEAMEVEKMADLAEIAARAAMMREETRGHHFRSDFPDRDDSVWLAHTVACKKGTEIGLWKEPVKKIKQGD